MPESLPASPAGRALRDGRSVVRCSRRGAKGGLRIDDSKQLFCVRQVMEVFADVQPSLALLARSDDAVGDHDGGRSGLGREPFLLPGR